MGNAGIAREVSRGSPVKLRGFGEDYEGGGRMGLLGGVERVVWRLWEGQLVKRDAEVARDYFGH